MEMERGIPPPGLANQRQKDDIFNWLVVSTPLKNISQMGLVFPIYGLRFEPTNWP